MTVDPAHDLVDDHNPLNVFDASWPLSRPCGKCGAPRLVRCGTPCHGPQPIGPELIRVTPGDDYDTNPVQHPAATNPEQWRQAQ